MYNFLSVRVPPLATAFAEHHVCRRQGPVENVCMENANTHSGSMPLRHSGKDRRGIVASSFATAYNRPMVTRLLPIHIAVRSLSNPTSLMLPALMSMGAEHVGHLAAES